MEQARRPLLSRLRTLASLEMLTREKMFSLAKTRGLSPAEADLTFRVAMGELAIVEQHCPIPLVANFGILIVVQLLSNFAVSIGLQ